MILAFVSGDRLVEFISSLPATLFFAGCLSLMDARFCALIDRTTGIVGVLYTAAVSNRTVSRARFSCTLQQCTARDA